MKNIKVFILLIILGFVGCKDEMNTTQSVYVIENNTDEDVIVLVTLRDEVVKSGYTKGGFLTIEANHSRSMSFPKYTAGKSCRPSSIFTGLTFVDTLGIVIKDENKIYDRYWKREKLYSEGPLGSPIFWTYSFEGN